MKCSSNIKILIGCLLVLSLSSCNNNRPDYVPDNNEMASLLYYIHLTESLANTNQVKDKNQAAALYKNIMQEYNMSNGRFDSCITWFSNNKKEYKKVYNIVKSQLELERNHILAGAYASEIANKYNHLFDFRSQFFESKDSIIFYLPEIKLPSEFSRDDCGSYPYIERLSGESALNIFGN